MTNNELENRNTTPSSFDETYVGKSNNRSEPMKFRG